MQKRALITGITGQDGSYLAEFLLNKGGYEVFGMYRRSSIDSHFERVDHLKGKINLVCADLLDSCSLEKVISDVMPDEVYNLAAQSQVRISFKQPYLTDEINRYGVERLLDSVKKHVPNSKFYQASTSELYGGVSESPQNEETPFNPVSPYAESKLNAHKTIQRVREEGMFACSGILFNHESPRRGIEFITRKITDGFSRFKLGLPQRVTGKNHLEIGNLEAKRDWGYAGDYVEAMWLMLQNDVPEDFVIATGECHSVRDFVEETANQLGIEIRWHGEGVNETGYELYTGKLIVAVNEEFFRPVEVHQLVGDYSKAEKRFGWIPKTKFNRLVKIMVEADLKELSK